MPECHGRVLAIALPYAVVCCTYDNEDGQQEETPEPDRMASC